MKRRLRIPITAVAVFGVGGLIALAIAIVLYFGLSSATENTRRLWAEQSDTLVASMESSVDIHLRPVVEQARWIARQVELGELDISNRPNLDSFMFGTLAATPQVTGIAIVTRDAEVRQWERARRIAVTRDWSNRPEIIEWLVHGESQTGSSWIPPIWESTTATTALVHTMPLRRRGEYLGMVGQIVPISDLSTTLATEYSEEGLTPFVLYDREFVLAHPLLKDWIARGTKSDFPLLSAAELGDPVLQRIWTPDEEQPFFLRGLAHATAAVGVVVDDVYYVCLYRISNEYGSEPWTIGAYLNSELHGDQETTRILKTFRGGVVGADCGGRPGGVRRQTHQPTNRGHRRRQRNRGKGSPG